ncbi:hypothetical protein Pfo_025091 [Paulownia fortunei]|nr:hypothetical protein Pfo_025091 [Paulownia fortunei]
MQSKDQEPSIAEAEQTYEKEAEDSLLEDQEPINIEQTEGESDDKDAKIVTLESSTISENQDAKIVTVESPTVLEHQDAKIVTVDSPTVLEHKDAKIATVESSTVSEHQDVSLGVKTEKPEDKSHIEEISSKQQEIKEDTINEMNNINTDESVAGNPNEEVEEKEIEEEATALNKKEEAASGSEAHESKETEVQEVVVEEKPENVAPKTQVAHGKKDSAVSNDVIEETANKLREQRKNKVKALAGAFETVISLQEPK